MRSFILLRFPGGRKSPVSPEFPVLRDPPPVRQDTECRFRWICNPICPAFRTLFHDFRAGWNGLQPNPDNGLRGAGSTVPRFRRRYIPICYLRNPPRDGERIFRSVIVYPYKLRDSGTTNNDNGFRRQSAGQECGTGIDLTTDGRMNPSL